MVSGMFSCQACQTHVNTLSTVRQMTVNDGIKASLTVLLIFDLYSFSGGIVLSGCILDLFFKASFFPLVTGKYGFTRVWTTHIP